MPGMMEGDVEAAEPMEDMDTTLDTLDVVPADVDLEIVDVLPIAD